MKAMKKRLLAIAMSAVTGVSAFGLGLYLLSPFTATAESKMPTVTNLEDVIDDSSDFYFVNANFGHLYGGTDKNSTLINTLNTEQGTDKNYEWAVYDRKVNETTDTHTINYYYNKETNKPLHTREGLVNENDYDGNYSFYVNRTDNKQLQASGITVSSVTDKNAIVSFRMNWEGGFQKFYSRYTPNGNSLTNLYLNSGKGYYVRAFNDGGTFFQFRAKGMTTDAYKVTKTQFLTEYNETNGTSYTIDDLLTKGDMVIITYGTYDVSTTEANMYFKVYNDTKDLLVFEKTVTVSSESDTTDYTTAVTYPHIMFREEDQYDGSLQNDRTPITIAGVNEPLLENTTNEGLTLDGTYSVGSTLSTVSLPTGYSWKNSLATLTEGVNAYVAVYEYNYYGVKTREVAVDVTAVAGIPEMPTVTNLEDVINSSEDFYFVNANFGHLYGGTDKNSTFINTLNTEQGTDKNYEWAVYDRKVNETTDTHTINYYYNKETNKPLHTREGLVNENDYDGNYSFYINRTENKALDQSGVTLSSVTDKDAIISFKMNWMGGHQGFYSRYVPNSNSLTNTYIGSGKGYEIYAFRQDNFFRFREKGSSTDAYKITRADFVTEYNETNGTSYTIDDIMKKGDMLTITYGTYDSASATYMYFKVYNDTKDLLVFEKTVECTLDTTVYEGDGAVAAYPHIRLWYNDNTDSQLNYDRTPITIAGVNEPLLAKDYAYTVADAYEAGALLSTVTLPAGYAFKNAAQALTGGTNEYDATYTYTYYDNKQITKDCKITVTGTEAASYSVAIKDGDNVLSSDAVEEGQTYTFTALTGREKTFIAYVGTNGAWYNVGDTVTVSSDMEFSVLEITFLMNDKVSVRMITDENTPYYGGLRYSVQISAEDYALISSKTTAATMIIPTMLIDGELEATEEQAQSKPATFVDVNDGVADYKISYFAITNIKHSNYAMAFTGAAFLTVTYADGDTAYVMSNAKSASAYDLAIEAYAANEQQKINEGVGLYSEDNVKLLKQYINGVVDVSYTVEGETLSVDFSDFGLDLEKGYTLDSTKTVVEKNADSYNVSITLNVEGSILETLLAEGVSTAPVVVRNENAADYKNVAVQRTYDATAHTLTLTFVVQA